MDKYQIVNQDDQQDLMKTKNIIDETGDRKGKPGKKEDLCMLEDEHTCENLSIVH